jgi:hypothetical protein
MGNIAAMRQLFFHSAPFSGGELKPRALRVVVYCSRRRDRTLSGESGDFFKSSVFDGEHPVGPAVFIYRSYGIMKIDAQ